jgi:hypothetical protein
MGMTQKDQTSRRQAVLKYLNAAVHYPPVRWVLTSLSFAFSLLLILLLLTVQLRWLRPPWPPPVIHVLFRALLVTSVFGTAVFGVASLGSAVILYRHRETDKQADAATLMRRGLVLPATYVLAAFWSASWLVGRPSRLLGASLIGVYIVYQVMLIIYSILRICFKAAASHPSPSHPSPSHPSQPRTGRPSGFGKKLTQTLKARWSRRMVKLSFALHRKWWLLKHPRYVEKMKPADRALFQSVARGVTQNVDVFLKRGVDPNLRLQFDQPLIVFCASLGQTESVRQILDAGGDVSSASPPGGLTALHCAADSGNMVLARLLCERSANLEARLRDGATPLMLAARNGHSGVIEVLLSCGALVNARTPKGTTALIFAASQGQRDAVQALLDGGADSTLKTEKGLTALDYARRKKSAQVVALLGHHSDG